MDCVYYNTLKHQQSAGAQAAITKIERYILYKENASHIVVKICYIFL